MIKKQKETPAGGHQSGATVEKALSETLFINDSTTTTQKIKDFLAGVVACLVTIPILFFFAPVIIVAAALYAWEVRK